MQDRRRRCRRFSAGGVVAFRATSVVEKIRVQILSRRSFESVIERIGVPSRRLGGGTSGILRRGRLRRLILIFVVAGPVGGGIAVVVVVVVGREEVGVVQALRAGTGSFG